jgi:hypothetical protein
MIVNMKYMEHIISVSENIIKYVQSKACAQQWLWNGVH